MRYRVVVPFAVCAMTAFGGLAAADDLPEFLKPKPPVAEAAEELPAKAPAQETAENQAAGQEPESVDGDSQFALQADGPDVADSPTAAGADLIEQQGRDEPVQAQPKTETGQVAIVPPAPGAPVALIPPVAPAEPQAPAAPDSPAIAESAMNPSTVELEHEVPARADDSQQMGVDPFKGDDADYNQMAREFRQWTLKASIAQKQYEAARYEANRRQLLGQPLPGEEQPEDQSIDRLQARLEAISGELEAMRAAQAEMTLQHAIQAEQREKEDSYKLVGVLQSGGTPLALIRHAGSFYRVAVGESVGDCSMKALDSRKATLACGDETKALGLGSVTGAFYSDQPGAEEHGDYGPYDEEYDDGQGPSIPEAIMSHYGINPG